MKNTLVLSLLASTLLVAPRLASAEPSSLQTPAMPQIGLFAASRPGQNGTVDVLLRWLPGTSWVPVGKGFNVYRTVAGVRTGPLNSVPIAENTSLAVDDPKNTVHLKDALSTARQKPIGSLGRLPSIASAQSSQSAFQSFKQNVGTLAKLQNGLASAVPPPSVDATVHYATSTGASHDYLLRLRGPKSTALAVAKPAPTTMSVQSAQAILATAASADPVTASALGLAFTDSGRPVAQTATYELRFVNIAGVESASLATVTVTARPAVPPAPKNLDAVQVGNHQVFLRWDSLSPSESTGLLLPSYTVMRVDPVNDAAHPDGVLLQAKPIIQSKLLSNDGSTWYENLFSFEDATAPISSSVIYKVYTHDGFGRISAPATFPANPQTKFAVADWQTPQSPMSADVAKVNGNPTARIVTWIPAVDSRTIIPNSSGTGNIKNPKYDSPIDPDARYRIYRFDAENSLAPPVLINPKAADQVFVAPAPSIVDDGATLSPSDTAGELPVQVKNGKPVKPPIRKPSKNSIEYIPGGLQFTDPNVPVDHKYRYLVRAYFDKNKLESSGTLTGVFEAPTVVAGPAPQHAAATFALLATRPYIRFESLGLVPKTTVISTMRVVRTGLPDKAHLTSIASKSLSLAKSPQDQVKSMKVSPGSSVGSNPGWASEQILTWDALKPINPTAPKNGFTYEVLRTEGAVAIRPFQDPHPGGKGISVFAAFTPNFTQSALETHPIVLAGVTGLNVTSFTDTMLPSRVGQDWTYRIIGIDRWGTKSTVAMLTAHSRPSLAPSAPMLLTAVPVEGDVRLTVSPNAPGEEVALTGYKVYRRPLLANEVPSKALADDAHMGEYAEIVLAQPATLSSAGEVVLIDTTNKSDVSYVYRVVAQNSSFLLSGYSAYLVCNAHRIPAPDVPTSVQAAVGNGPVAAPVGKGIGSRLTGIGAGNEGSSSSTTTLPPARGIWVTIGLPAVGAGLSVSNAASSALQTVLLHPNDISFEIQRALVPAGATFSASNAVWSPMVVAGGAKWFDGSSVTGQTYVYRARIVGMAGKTSPFVLSSPVTAD